ncbi:unnamed protein product [Polarella glacialis]|uniref:Alcohol dehydrogenase 4 n=1 Tax=Polarella glacialis TaxID=89957 RepID=A0A813JE59_POLGL|nr:unnamed protein product [Polarella glacialis]CAE8676542.1 unnamed protein product [Polarella glacialis]CAE8676955.1 unnamed protein product [Polarella glacialis]
MGEPEHTQKRARSAQGETDSKMEHDREHEVEERVRLFTDLEWDLAGHSTLGPHSVNYHHPRPGNKGSVFFMPNRSFLGEGALHNALQSVKALGLKKALLVTDKMLVKSGAVKTLTDVLDKASIKYSIFHWCDPIPSCAQVESGLKLVQQEGCEFIISFGCHAPHNCAKAIGIAFTNGGSIRDYAGADKSRKPMLPLVAVNTAAGTGAEMDRFCTIKDEHTGQNLDMVDWRLMPALAVNDPTLTVGMPPRLTAATGMDALTHAIEAYVSTASTPVTDASALHAIRLISTYLPEAVEDGTNAKARDMMAHAEFLAAMAFNSAGLGYVHAMSHQIGPAFSLAHGMCNAILLGPVQEYNAKYVPALFIDIAHAMGFVEVGQDSGRAVKAVLECIRTLKDKVGIPKNFQALNANPADFLRLAEAAMKDACASTNPHQPTKDEVCQIFHKAYNLDGVTQSFQ